MSVCSPPFSFVNIQARGRRGQEGCGEDAHAARAKGWEAARSRVSRKAKPAKFHSLIELKKMCALVKKCFNFCGLCAAVRRRAAGWDTASKASG